jgi:hypothetical protein
MMKGPLGKRRNIDSMLIGLFFHLVPYQCLEFIKPQLKFMQKLLLLIKWPSFSK